MLTHMILARPPTSSSTRSRISAAALLVKVIARIEPGWALRSEISHAIRRVSTRVLPEPAPATTSSGAPSWTTASRCGSLSPSSSSSRVGRRRLRGLPRLALVGLGVVGQREGRGGGTARSFGPTLRARPDRSGTCPGAFAVLRCARSAHRSEGVDDALAVEPVAVRTADAERVEASRRAPRWCRSAAGGVGQVWSVAERSSSRCTLSGVHARSRTDPRPCRAHRPPGPRRRRRAGWPSRCPAATVVAARAGARSRCGLALLDHTCCRAGGGDVAVGVDVPSSCSDFNGYVDRISFWLVRYDDVPNPSRNQPPGADSSTSPERGSVV